MSDSEDSTFTHTTVSSPYEGRSRDLSPGVDGPPVMSEDPYAYVVAVFQALPPPDYVPGPKEPEQAPPSPVYIPYVPELMYPEYIPPEDDDLEEDDDEDPEEDPANYPADHDDDGEEEEPSRDDANEEDEEQDEDDDDKEEEHLALADSIPPLPTLRVMARISFRPQPPTLSFTKEDAERFLAMPIPPPSPVTPLSSPLQQIPSPPLQHHPLSSPYYYLLHHHPYSYYLLTIEQIDPMLPFHIEREDIKYGIRDTWIDPRDVAEEEALTTLEGVNTRVTELAAVQEQDTQDIYGVMEDTQGRRLDVLKRLGRIL
nr:hypothetical protein [Tanacetum cinerariifolium]